MPGARRGAGGGKRAVRENGPISDRKWPRREAPSTQGHSSAASLYSEAFRCATSRARQWRLARDALLEVIEREEEQGGFETLPRHWVVE